VNRSKRLGKVGKGLLLVAPTVFGGYLSSMAAVAEDQAVLPIHLSFSGTPGMIEMPSARALPDATLGVTISNFSGFHRNTLTF
jgi:Exopolysaccharide biosynthesis protein YbjH